MFGAQIFIDLSKCQFAELGALAQLILVIESFLKNRHIIYFALPTTRLTERQAKSENSQEIAKKNLKLQILANNFLKKTGFISALQEIAKIHNAEIYFTEDYDYVSKKEGINIDGFKDSYSIVYEELIINDDNYKFLLPFRWIDCKNDQNEIRDLEKKLDKILENDQRGIETFDAQVIKNIILSELIKNVKMHAKTRYAIFVVGLIQTRSILLSNQYKKPNPIELEYLDYIKGNNIGTQVEIYFGDSGIGLLNETYKNKISDKFQFHKSNSGKLLEYSFNKWSSIQDDEPRRGTKGLYRLKRIVDKYKGILHIKSSTSNGGFFQHKYDYREFNASFKGTFISVKLNPYKEIKSFKLTTLRRPNSKGWISTKLKIDKELKCLDEIRFKILDEKNILILTDISIFNISKDSKILERFFYEISYISHPSAIVLYLIDSGSDINNDTIDTLIDSVQTYINKAYFDGVDLETQNPDQEEVHDPVLVLGSNNTTFWYGGSNSLIEIINESYLSENPIQISNFESFSSLNDHDKVGIKNYFESNSNLVVLNEKKCLEFNFFGIEHHYEKKVAVFKPQISATRICTPKLNIVNQWIDILNLIENDEYGFALCMYIKYRREFESEGREINQLEKSNSFVLIDHSQQYNLSKKFAELLGIRQKNIRNISEEIDYTTPRRSKIFNDKSNVIFLTTVVSSSETIRRMVKYAKRDLAIPDSILCIMNFRKYNISSLETWNDTTPIISVFQKNKSDLPKNLRSDEYFQKKFEDLKNIEEIINPNFSLEGEESFSSFVTVDDSLISYLAKNKLLHYNHYGNYNKRHFTFFLDKHGIINSKGNFIIEKIKESVWGWLEKNQIEEYTFYINKKLIDRGGDFVNRLKESLNCDIEMIDVSKRTLTATNSVYFDFGILTGESINNLINKAEELDNLLVCILFNQSINSNANSYRKISKLKYAKKTSILDEEDRFINFDIEYLYDLPLSFYDSGNCPICEHRSALDRYKLDTPYFIKFSNDRRERLKQSPSEDIMELIYPVDFYFSEKEEEKRQELSSNIIKHMYEFKILLENALNYTSQRIQLFNYLYNIYSNIQEEIINSESKVFSTLYYLSHEINWLQQEPLVFRDFRELLAKISLEIAKIPLDDLATHFEKSNMSDIPNKNLATRYKYSAISVLRSSNKLLFCEQILDILTSSISENRFSDNLLQNTLYHIASFFKNTYNKSEIYFIEIERNLSNIPSFSQINQSQRKAINYILKENRTHMKKASKLQKEPLNFREMKNYWEEKYNVEMPKHPAPFKEWNDLVLKQQEDTFILLASDPNYPEEMKNLQGIIEELPEHYESLQAYINDKIIFYFNDKLTLLMRSAYFNDKCGNRLSVDNIQSNLEELYRLIMIIRQDFSKYLNHSNSYSKITDYLSDNIFKKENLGGLSSNSTFLRLLDDFPSTVSQIIKESFPPSEFPNFDLSFQYRQEDIVDDLEWKVYFPQSLFRRHLDWIKTNIRQKKNAGCSLSDIKLSILISIENNEIVDILISYDKTEKWSGTPNPKGSLNTFKAHIEQFGGQFDSGMNGDIFYIKIKLLRYE